MMSLIKIYGTGRFYSLRINHYAFGFCYTGNSHSDLKVNKINSNLQRHTRLYNEYMTKFREAGIDIFHRFPNNIKNLAKVYKIFHHHHHYIALGARISLTLSRHSSLSFIALGRSSGQQSVSSHSC